MDLNTKDSCTDGLHKITPVVASDVLRKYCNQDVLLKMDNLQPSGSFKIRGISNLISKSMKNGVTHIVNSSGGNAGMATSYSSFSYKIPTTIVIPESTPKMMIDRLKEYKVEVIVHGQNWNAANEMALDLAKNDNWLYVHPYHHELIWEGHSSIVEEIHQQVEKKPAAIVLSVGGGGLLCGVLEGLRKINDWKDIPVVAMETEGAHCFNAALKAGKPVSIGSITSIAKTLGALSVTERVFDLLPDATVISKVISDKDAIKGVIEFYKEKNMLVEPSCGAALAAGHTGIIKDLIKSGDIKSEGPIIFIVCGGSAVTLEMIEEWKKQFNLS